MIMVSGYRGSSCIPLDSLGSCVISVEQVASSAGYALDIAFTNQGVLLNVSYFLFKLLEHDDLFANTSLLQGQERESSFYALDTSSDNLELVGECV